MTKEIRKMDYVELSDYITEIVSELKRKAYAEGYKQGRFDAEMEHYRYEPTDDITYWSPQAKRDRIVERAKADVAKLIKRGMDVNALGGTEGNETFREYFYFTEFVVNKEKRTVVAIIKGASGRGKLFGVWHRGIAKCAPDDCFNVHIGKAIALRRALGLEVPDEYLNAPQPTEVRVGDVVKSKGGTVNKVVKLTENHMYYPDGYCNSIGLVERGYSKIIDDSREEVSE